MDLERFVLRSTVYVGYEADGQFEHGSGTLVATRAGAVALLTAGHVIRDSVAHSYDRRLVVGGHLAWDGEKAAAVEINRVGIHCKENVDIAVVLLPTWPDLQKGLAPLAVPRSMIAEARAVSDEQFAVICGFPRQFSRPGRILGATAYATKFKGADSSAMSFHWDKALNRSRDLVNLRAGYGVSGGAVWSFRRAIKGEPWTPHTSGSLIGVAHQRTDGQAQLAIPSCNWRAWALAVLDA